MGRRDSEASRGRARVRRACRLSVSAVADRRAVPVSGIGRASRPKISLEDVIKALTSIEEHSASFQPNTIEKCRCVSVQCALSVSVLSAAGDGGVSVMFFTTCF